MVNNKGASISRKHWASESKEVSFSDENKDSTVFLAQKIYQFKGHTRLLQS